MRRLSKVFDFLIARKRFFSSSTLDLSEVNKFSALSQQWWREIRGPFAGLHRLNEVRIPIIRDAALKSITNLSIPLTQKGHSLSNISICDIGCGGGILSEALARLGATVTGIDASAPNISAAKFHASLDPFGFPGGLTYKCTTAESLAVTSFSSFDLVVCSEVVEHVADVDELIRALSVLVKPGGSVVVTTLNRTLPSFFLAIVAGEYILKAVPAGTHEWAKFIPPSVLFEAFTKNGLVEEQLIGLGYDPFSQKWHRKENKDVSVNYAHVFRKPGNDKHIIKSI
jgi:ubiquinone biosynthesis O-methyltransferase